MGSTSTLPVQILSVWFALLICSVGIVMAADPDPLVDVSPLANETFVLRDVFKNGDVSEGPGGTRAALNITLFPASISEGITYVQFRMKPCGENLPHTHPRATEILTLVSGGPLQAGLVDTAGNAHIYILYPQDVILFPRGLLHFELNVGTEEAFYISALNSQNPGVLTAGGVLLKLPTRAAATALNQDVATTQKLASQIYPYSGKLQMDKNAGCVPGNPRPKISYMKASKYRIDRSEGMGTFQANSYAYSVESGQENMSPGVNGVGGQNKSRVLSYCTSIFLRSSPA